MNLDDSIHFADELFSHAGEHYTEGGWDVIVECWTVDLVLEAVEGMTWDEAWELFKNLASVWADRQADARNSAF